MSNININPIIMKKLLLITAVVCLSLGQLNAQEPTFVKGDKVLNVALGLGNTLYTGTHYKGQIPPLSGSLEFGVVDNIIDEKGVIGVGPYIGYSSYKWEYLDWGWKYSNLIIGAKGNLHYPFVDKLDTYVGLLLGYNVASSKEFGVSIPGYDYSYSAGGITWAGFVGARYYGIAYLNIGVALKL